MSALFSPDLPNKPQFSRGRTGRKSVRLFYIEVNFLNPRLKELRAKAMALPLSPGVYIMKNNGGKIIYIGKAKALKNRVSQYFGSPQIYDANKNYDAKVRQMVEHVATFDYIVTDSEFEALVLECSLIKQHQPKYNILLKDDKGYYYIRISPPPWSRITEAKQLEQDGACYLGPYTGGLPVKESVDEAVKAFKLPVCNRKFPQEIGKGRPCLNYFIKQCCAPCRGGMTADEYQEIVNEAVDFLRGGSAASLRTLTQKMEDAAEKLQFERAAKLRDRIAAIRRLNERQKVFASKVEEQDVIAVAQGISSSCFEVFRFTEGRLCDRENFILGEIGNLEEAREEFLQRYYTIRNYIPPQITLDGPPSNQELLARWLSEKAGRQVKIIVPQIGEQKRLVEMCRNNAAEQIAQRTGNSGRETAALDELSRLLGLESVPAYIESYDISNLAGSENVAGMVVFENGRPLKSAYRKFKIKGFEGQDDYGSMREVINRRLDEYEKEKNTHTGFGRLPDLILLDGGKGHVSVVRPLIAARGFHIPVYGMVKDDKHRTRAIAEDGGEISISSKRAAFTLVSSIQEEVHRFAIGYHRQSRSKNMISSSLDKIEGIGAKRAKALLRHFRTISRIREATLEELELVEGLTKPAAKAVYDHFHQEEE